MGREYSRRKEGKQATSLLFPGAEFLLKKKSREHAKWKNFPVLIGFSGNNFIH